MLWNQDWDKPQTKADPLTLESLIAWLEQWPSGKIYCYGKPAHCLAAQYNKSIGREYHVVGLCGRNTERFDYRLEQIACDLPRTFGAALERARAALASRA